MSDLKDKTTKALLSILKDDSIDAEHRIAAGQLLMQEAWGQEQLAFNKDAMNLRAAMSAAPGQEQ